jgi:hypothetical protein
MKSICLLILLSFLPVAVHAQPVQPGGVTGDVQWGDWEFRYTIDSPLFDGLVIVDVKWKGTRVLSRGSLPTVLVKYRGNEEKKSSGCGPYADHLHYYLYMGGESGTGIAGTFTSEVEIRVHGDEWFEIGVFAEIGGYNFWQAWMFNRKQGRLKAVLQARGWSCGESPPVRRDHRHHAYWKMDFDVDGSKNEVWAIRNKKTSVGGILGDFAAAKIPKEWNDWQLDDDELIAWMIVNPVSQKHVLIKYRHKESRDLPGKPWFGFSHLDAGIRVFHQTEDEFWPHDPMYPLGYMMGPEIGPELFSGPESLEGGKDIVFWAVAHLSHKWTSADEDNPQWHPTGFDVWVNW